MPILIFLRPIGLDYWNPLRYVCTVRALHHCAPFLPPSVLLALSSYDSIENTGKAVPAPDTQWATVTERQRVHEKMSATRRLAPGGGGDSCSDGTHVVRHALEIVILVSEREQ